MENTGKVLFEKDSPQWYIAEGDHWVGPLTAADVYQKVLQQEISWAHFVWKPGQASWERICDVKTFQAVVPQLPGRTLQKEVKVAAQPPSPSAVRKGTGLIEEEKKWFLHFNDTQYGPFALSEVNRFLKTGKITPQVFAWCDGMENWQKIAALDGFEKGKSVPPPPAPVGPKTRKAEKRSETPGESSAAGSKESRRAPRRPLVARIMMAHQQEVIIAMCRDISVGGMQALTDQIPGDVGSRVKMNVSATGDKKLEPFTAEGVIVRILEDRRGFSFRFEKLTDHAKGAIEKYIEASN